MELTPKQTKDLFNCIISTGIAEICQVFSQDDEDEVMAALLEACEFAKAQIKKGSQKKALPILREAIALAKSK